MGRSPVQRAMKRVRMAWLVVSALLASDVAHAQFAIDARATGVAGTAIDFDALGLPNYAPVLSVSGITFENAFYGGAGLLGSAFTTPGLYNVPPTDAPFGVLRIRFTAPVVGAAFNLVTDDATTTFTAYLAGVSVHAFTRQTDASRSTSFYGFEGLAFDRIDVETILNGNTEQIAFTGIDNLQVEGSPIEDEVTVTPEPATFALALFGFGALGVFTRRRTRAG